MRRAVDRLTAAIRSGESIAVYGDFDVDGVTATAILSEGLADLGAHVKSFIPNRFRDGYGVTSAAMTRLRGEGVGLVLTVDCGITANREVDEAQRAGLEVIVLDHHEPGATLPDAAAVIDPKRSDSRYATRDLCSGALALRLLQALYTSLNRPLETERYLDLAALATVCDMVPLQGENRDLVKAGLRVLPATTHPGLRALLAVISGPNEVPDADTLGFLIGPRLNAAGRLEDASLALELLTTRDEARAAALVQQLGALNQRRQAMVDQALLIAQGLAEQEPVDSRVLVVGDPSISRGIVGLIASRLVELYRRPAFVYEVSDRECVGSARGMPGFDVVLALQDSSHLLERHGGHKAAGGFALRSDNLVAFKQSIELAAEKQMARSAIEDILEIDAESHLREIDQQTLSYVAQFAPCGAGNPAPRLMSRDVSVVSARSVGNGKHLMLDLRDGRINWRSFAFGRGDAVKRVGKMLDIVYSIEMGSRGYGPRLRLIDWHESTMKGVGR